LTAWRFKAALTMVTVRSHLFLKRLEILHHLHYGRSLVDYGRSLVDWIWIINRIMMGKASEQTRRRPK